MDAVAPEEKPSVPELVAGRNAAHIYLTSRWAKIPGEFLALLRTAAFLDPRFKNYQCVLKEEYRPVYEACIQKLNQPGPAQNAAASVEEDIEELVALNVASAWGPIIFSPPRQGPESLSQQIVAFWNAAPIPMTQSPFQWWSRNESRYPDLAGAARNLLCIPSTSVASERVFSREQQDSSLASDELKRNRRGSKRRSSCKRM